MKKIYIIAGEPSGDLLASSVMREINLRNTIKVEIMGVGGSLMAKEGLESLFDISEISIGGITEIIPRLFRIKHLIDLTVEDIVKHKPNVVLTVDSPGFCFQVAKKLRARKIETKLVHLVAPSVWAWRPGRAKKISKIYDQLLTLFDFEPKYFSKYGLNTIFVGHPSVENIAISNEEKEDTVLIMPGSRFQEIKTLLPEFLVAACKLNVKRLVIPTLPHLEPLIRTIVTDSNGVEIVSDNAEKSRLYRRAKFAIVASGTATLELALSGCPMVVCYKLSAVSYAIVRLLVKVKYISLVNIILDKPVVQELIQNNCNATSIFRAALEIDPREQMAQFQDIRTRLTDGRSTPSKKIADILIGL